MKILTIILICLALTACEVEQPFEIAKEKQEYMAKFCDGPAGGLEDLYKESNVVEYNYYHRLNDGKKVWFVLSVTCKNGETFTNPNYPEATDQFTR